MKNETAENIRFFSPSKMRYIQAVFGDNIANAFPRHIHNTFCIGMIDRGSRIIFCRGSSTVIPEGGLFIINPDEPHSCKSYDKSGQNYRILCVDANFMQAIALQISEKNSTYPLH